MTEATKPDISPEKERGALLRSLAVNLKNLMYKSVARLLSMQPAFYTFALASLTVTSTRGCSVATILSKPEILILRWLRCSAIPKRA